jgi:hypothetical protein
MAGFKDFFTKAGSAGTQLFTWQVLGTVIGAAGAPFFADVQHEALRAHPNTPIDAGQAAGMVARGLQTTADVDSDVSASGVNSERFQRLVNAARNSPGLSDVVAAYHRGLVSQGDGDPTTPSLTGAFADAGIRPEWWPILEAASTQLPSWQAALNADLQGQLTREQAKDWFVKAGGDPDAYQWLYDSNGQAPTPSQALELLNRGIIPQSGTGPESTSYEQAFLEGPWRNKWLQPFLALREYLPPPRTVTAMYREGSLSKAEATDLLIKQGLSADLAAKYLISGDSQAAQTSKDLTQSAVIGLYEARVIAQADAQQLLEALGYDETNAAFLIQLADLRRTISAVNTAVSRVHSLYTGHKIDKATASQVLLELQVPADQVADILSVWTLEASVNVKTLTPAQIADAWSNNIIDQHEAIAELQAVGYTPYDAWVLLSIKNKQALPDKPPQGPAPVGGI